MAKILYIHGFASCGNSTKTKLLKAYYGEDVVCAPDVPIDPDEAILLLQKLIEREGITLLIGSSLGGFYASYLSEYFRIKAVLINPSTTPYTTLASYIGENTYWCSKTSFIWTQAYLEALRSYVVLPTPLRYLLLLHKGDEVLDYKVAEAFYLGAKTLNQEGGNHRFENLESYFKEIDGFRV